MATTILSTIQKICPKLGIPVPVSAFGSTEKYMVELSAMANDVAQRIAFDGHDWTKLKTLATLTGDGVKTEFDLPADYRRMLKKAQLWPSYSPFVPLTHYPDLDQWLGLTVQNYQVLEGAWTIIGEKINIRPAIPAGATVQFFYISGLIVKGPGPANTPKTEFTDNSDTFILDERLLRLALVWQWKSDQGQAYGEDMSSYEDALASISGADRGSNIIATGRPRYPVDVAIAYPGVILP